MPIVSMYGIFSYIYHTNQPNVGIYTIHGYYGIFSHGLCLTIFIEVWASDPFAPPKRFVPADELRREFGIFIWEKSLLDIVVYI